MSSFTLSTARARTLWVLLALGLSVATAAALLSTADASSHREAPLIMEDPVADNTGDANPDITDEFRFQNAIQNPNEYLDGDAVAALDGRGTVPITSLDDDTYNFRQTMSVSRVSEGTRTQLASNLTLPPAHVGPITTGDDANYDQLAQQGVHDVGDGVKAFAGQRDDGFFVDIASIFDIGTLRPFQGAHALPPGGPEEGRDTFAGYNVHTIGLQVPKALLRGAADDPVVGVYSTAERRKVRVFSQNSSAMPVNRGRWVQVLDAPPFSTEGDIPLVTDPILAAQIAALYEGVDVPPAPRDDLVSVYLTGIEGVNQSPNLSRPSEMLRVNMDVEPSGTDLNASNRLGFLGGENDGFPNGRRPGDDVVDISLRAVAGGYPLTPDFNKEPNTLLTDGVIGNDKPFLNEFPYLPTPHRGFDLTNRDRVPGAQPQNPANG